MTSPIKVTEIIKEANGTLTYKFNIPKGVSWEAGANGHFLVTDAQGDFQLSRTYVRHLSIMSQPEEGFIGFTTRIKEQPSLFKQSLKNYKVGDEMRFFKIKNHIPLQRNNSHVVLISMGVGIATYRPMILNYANNQEGINSMTNINIDSTKQFVYQDELRAIETPNYFNKFVNDRIDLKEEIQNTLHESNTSYYVVGSDEFLKDIGTFLMQHNISEANVHFDKHAFQKNEFLKKSA